MKITQIINVQGNSFIQYKDENGEYWREPIVALGLIVDEDGCNYIDPLVMSVDGEIVPLSEIKANLYNAVVEKVVWNDN